MNVAMSKSSVSRLWSASDQSKVSSTLTTKLTKYRRRLFLAVDKKDQDRRCDFFDVPES